MKLGFFLLLLLCDFIDWTNAGIIEDWECFFLMGFCLLLQLVPFGSRWHKLGTRLGSLSIFCSWYLIISTETYFSFSILIISKLLFGLTDWVLEAVVSWAKSYVWILLESFVITVRFELSQLFYMPNYLALLLISFKDFILFYLFIFDRERKDEISRNRLMTAVSCTESCPIHSFSRYHGVVPYIYCVRIQS